MEELRTHKRVAHPTEPLRLIFNRSGSPALRGSLDEGWQQCRKFTMEVFTIAGIDHTDFDAHLERLTEYLGTDVSVGYWMESFSPLRPADWHTTVRKEHVMRSIALEMFLEPFKIAAAEGAAVELKMRLLAGKVSVLQKLAHDIMLKDIEAGLIEHFGMALSDQDRKTLRLCRELRNKVLHSDFRAARDKLNELGIASSPGGVVRIDLPVVTATEVAKKIEAAKAGIEGVRVADTPSTDAGSVFGWFLEVGRSGDFDKASAAFKSAAEIIDRLAGIEGA